MDLDAYLEDFTRRDWQTPTDGNVRIAIAGLGRFAIRRALPAIGESEFCTATVLISGSPAKADDVAEEFDVGETVTYEQFADGAAVDAYDAVYVATPPAFHSEQTLQAARLGKHVLCEKPLAADVATAERMVNVCAERDVTLMTAYRLRTEPSIRRVREMIQDGVIGDVVQLVGGFSSRLLDHVGPDSWRLNADIAGGGALMDLGIYPLHLSRFLIDEEPTTTWGDVGSEAEAFNEVEEHGTVHLAYPSGATATCFASFNAHPDSRLQVLGTEGQLLVREPFGGDVAQELIVERRDTATEYTGPPVNEVVEEFDYFAHCILAGADCETDGADGYRDLRILDAAYEAAETGTRQAL